MPDDRSTGQRLAGRSLSNGLLALLLPLLLIGPAVAFAEPDFPQLTGRVVDQAAILDDSQETSLDAELEAHETATSNQLVVVTLPSLQGYDISDFSNRLIRHWQIGQAELDNGVLLVVAPSERKVRIEVGYGLEGALTDVISGDIIRRQILPQFREDDYPAGINRGVESIIGAIKGEYVLDPASLGGRNNNSNQPVKHFPMLFLAIIVLFEILKKFGWNKLGNSAFPTAMFGIAATAMSSNLVIGIVVSVGVFLVFFFFIVPRTKRAAGSATGSANSLGRQDDAHRDNSSYGSSGGGGFSGGGGSGGGGGASGGW